MNVACSSLIDLHRTSSITRFVHGRGRRIAERDHVEVVLLYGDVTPSSSSSSSSPPRRRPTRLLPGGRRLLRRHPHGAFHPRVVGLPRHVGHDRVDESTDSWEIVVVFAVASASGRGRRSPPPRVPRGIVDDDVRDRISPGARIREEGEVPYRKYALLRGMRPAVVVVPTPLLLLLLLVVPRDQRDDERQDLLPVRFRKARTCSWSPPPRCRRRARVGPGSSPTT